MMRHARALLSSKVAAYPRLASSRAGKAWMAGSSPAMTWLCFLFPFLKQFCKSVADVIGEIFRFFHRREVAAFFHDAPTLNVVAALRP